MTSYRIASIVAVTAATAAMSLFVYVQDQPDQSPDEVVASVDVGRQGAQGRPVRTGTHERDDESVG